VVFDTQGGETQTRSYASLKKGGILVSIVQPPSQDEAAAHGVRAVLAVNQADAETLAKLGALAESGKLLVSVDSVLPFHGVAQALEKIERGHTRGKIVLRVP